MKKETEAGSWTEKPENCEEARKIIRDAVGSKYDIKSNRAMIIRAVLNTLGALAVGALTGYLTGSSMAFFCFLPAAALVLVLSLVPIIIRHKLNKDIRSGCFFRKHSEQEIMDMAGNYVDMINQYEEKEKRKGQKEKQIPEELIR